MPEKCAQVRLQNALAIWSQTAHIARMTYVSKIIEAFGGVRPMARAINRPVSTVKSWGDRGSIPDRQKAEVIARAEALRLPLGPSDFLPGPASPPEAAE